MAGLAAVALAAGWLWLRPSAPGTVESAPSASPSPVNGPLPAVKPTPPPAVAEPTAPAETPKAVPTTASNVSGLVPAPGFGASSAPAFGVAWRRVADLPEPRAKFGAAVLDGKIYVVGGESRNGLLSSAVVYDPAAGRWAPAGSLTGPRASHAAVVAGGRLYAVGGFSGSSLVGSVEVFDPAANSWRPVEGAGSTMPTPRSVFGCAVVGDRILTFGGNRPVLEIFDTATGRWTSGGNLPWPLVGAAAVAWQDRVYLMGGFSGQAVSGAVHVYDAAAGRWLADAEQSLQARSGSAAVCDAGGALFLIAGRFGSALVGLIEVARTPGEKWWTVDALPASCANLQAVIAGGKLYTIGGVEGVPVSFVFEGTVKPQ